MWAHISTQNNQRSWYNLQGGRWCSPLLFEAGFVSCFQMSVYFYVFLFSWKEILKNPPQNAAAQNSEYTGGLHLLHTYSCKLEKMIDATNLCSSFSSYWLWQYSIDWLVFAVATTNVPKSSWGIKFLSISWSTLSFAVKALTFLMLFSVSTQVISVSDSSI